MYRVLKKDALMVSFYGWNRVDRFMAAWKSAGFSVVGHLVFTKTYASKSAYVGYRHECAYVLAKGRPPLPQDPLPDVLGWKYSGNRHHPTEKPVTSLQPLIESFTQRHCSRPVCRLWFHLCGCPPGWAPLHRY
jgi:site-specific DNA-methyltransferase (adenine-specific)